MIIVIEGIDGCGKETQAKAVTELLQGMGHVTRMISFPRYSSPSSSTAKMYLNGEFGKSAERINPYQASSMFAVDRVATYLKEIKPFMDASDFVLDRYVESNLIYQGAKIEDEAERKEFIDWEYDYEFRKLSLPIPDIVFLLNVSDKVYEGNIARRSSGSKHSGADIHESNLAFLRQAKKTGAQLALELGWNIIDCDDGEKMLPEEVITGKIMQGIKKNTSMGTRISSMFMRGIAKI